MPDHSPALIAAAKALMEKLRRIWRVLTGRCPNCGVKNSEHQSFLWE
jgi:uncharacterized protein (DUF983 family)